MVSSREIVFRVAAAGSAAAVLSLGAEAPGLNTTLANGPSQAELNHIAADMPQSDLSGHTAFTGSVNPDRIYLPAPVNSGVRQSEPLSAPPNLQSETRADLLLQNNTDAQMNRNTGIIIVDEHQYTPTGQPVNQETAELAGVEVTATLEDEIVFEPYASIELPNRPVQKAVFSADNQTLYTVGQGSVTVIDVSNPNEPEITREITVDTGYINDAKRSGDTLVIIGSKGIFSIDLTNSSGPSVKQLINPENDDNSEVVDLTSVLSWGKITVIPNGFAVSYNKGGFLSSSQTEMRFFQISDSGLSNAKKMSKLDFIGDRSDGMIIYDTAVVEKDGKTIMLVYTIPYYWSGSTLEPQLRQIDISDPQNPSKPSNPQQLTGVKWHQSGMVYDKGRQVVVFVDQLFRQVKVYDASDLDHLRLVSSFVIPQPKNQYVGNPIFRPHIYKSGQVVVTGHRSWTVDEYGAMSGYYQPGQVITIDIRDPRKPTVNYGPTDVPLAYDTVVSPDGRMVAVPGNGLDEYGFSVARDGNGMVALGSLKYPTTVYAPIGYPVREGKTLASSR